MWLDVCLVDNLGVLLVCSSTIFLRTVVVAVLFRIYRLNVYYMYSVH